MVGLPGIERIPRNRERPTELIFWNDLLFDMYERILVATDDSEHARYAIERAIDFARKHGATLHVIAVVDNRVYAEPGLSSDELVTVETEELYNEWMSDIGDRAAEVGVECEYEVCHGVPHECILEYADDVDADAIFVGAHGDHADHVGGVGQTVFEETDREVYVVEAGSQ